LNKSPCDECDPEKRKQKGFLCDDTFITKDKLPVRCIHKNSVLKLNILKYYLEIVSTALKDKFENRIFLDLFSGPGLCWDRDNRKLVEGSALIALKLANPFSNYVFVDLDKKTSFTLEERCKYDVPELFDRIKILNFNANRDINRILSKIPSQYKYLVVFIDPNGLDVHYDVIKKLASYKSVDLIINFSISDLKRNKDNYSTERDKADLFFGSKDWVNNKYLKFYRSQLKRCGFKVVEDNSKWTVRIKTTTKADIYYLVYASMHKKGLEFWEATKKRYLEPDIFNI